MPIRDAQPSSEMQTCQKVQRCICCLLWRQLVSGQALQHLPCQTFETEIECDAQLSLSLQAATGKQQQSHITKRRLSIGDCSKHGRQDTFTTAS